MNWSRQRFRNGHRLSDRSRQQYPHPWLMRVGLLSLAAWLGPLSGLAPAAEPVLPNPPDLLAPATTAIVPTLNQTGWQPLSPTAAVDLQSPGVSHAVDPGLTAIAPDPQASNPATHPPDWPAPVHDHQTFGLFLVDQLEYRYQDEADSVNWKAEGWVGGDYRRFWLKTEGDIALDGTGGDAEVQVLRSQLISPFWELQAGVRYDQHFSPEGDRGRAFAVVGLQGVAPYQIELETALFLSHEGDLSARLSAESQFLLSQRLILQPEVEVNAALQTVEAFGVGSGLTDLTLGLRLRYEFSREVAPYVGVVWTRKFGQTADLARDADESIDDLALVGGLRLLF